MILEKIYQLLNLNNETFSLSSKESLPIETTELSLSSSNSTKNSASLAQENSHYKDTIGPAKPVDNQFLIQASSTKNVVSIPPKPLNPEVEQLNQEVEQLERDDADLFKRLIKFIEVHRSQLNEQGSLTQKMMEINQGLLKKEQENSLALQEELQKNSKYAAIAGLVNSVLLGATVVISVGAVISGVGAGFVPALSAGAQTAMTWVGASIFASRTVTLVVTEYYQGQKRLSSELHFVSTEACKNASEVIEGIVKRTGDLIETTSKNDQHQRKITLYFFKIATYN